MEQKNIFVVGLDDINLRELEAIRNADRYRFHSLLDLKQIQEADQFPVKRWLEQAEERLRSFDGSIDAVIGFWDFPVVYMVPLLTEKFGLPGPSFQSVLACEHKYWSRLIHQRVVPEHTPGFQVMDPATESSEHLELDYPVWVKPITAYASQLGFQARDDAEMDAALNEIGNEIERFGDPLDELVADNHDQLRGKFEQALELLRYEVSGEPIRPTF